MNSIRAALGAGWWRLVRQSLTESMLLAVAGGAFGLILANWGTQAALSVLPTTLPRASEVQLDYRVLIFTIGVTLLSGILAGLAPALKNSKWRLSETLKESGRGSTSRGRHSGAGRQGPRGGPVWRRLMAAARALWNVDRFRPDNVPRLGSIVPVSRIPIPRRFKLPAIGADQIPHQASARIVSSALPCGKTTFLLD